MSSRIFQSIIIQMKDATDRCMGVVDDQGFVVACSELSMIGTKLDDFHGVLLSHYSVGCGFEACTSALPAASLGFVRCKTLK